MLVMQIEVKPAYAPILPNFFIHKRSTEKSAKTFSLSEFFEKFIEQDEEFFGASNSKNQRTTLQFHKLVGRLLIHNST